MITDKGLRMPKLGLGTWPMMGEECTKAVIGALELGYRHIDTAAKYENETAVGEAIANSPIKRAEYHVTSKVWLDKLAPDSMHRSFEQSLRDLRTDYVDLFLIHWPSPDMDLAASLAKLVSFQEQGLARNIGVSNFPLSLFRRTVEEIEAPIANHQIEYHVLFDQSPVINFARKHGISITAYCPLARGRLIGNPTLDAIGAKHGASGAQVALKWLLDQDSVAAIPKASRVESQTANFAAQTLMLDDEDRAAIAALPKDQRFDNPAWAPDWDA